MFFKKIKTSLITFLLTLLIPINILAYSDKLALGGENIGINISYEGILVVGLYQIDNQNPADDAGLKKGDIITKVNNQKTENIDEMIEQINSDDDKTVNITYKRANKTENTELNIIKDETGILKTGLYVKDSITGIGTLTYIDASTNIYGALGHEIIEQTTGKILEIKNGEIYESTVTGIIPSNNGTPGEKQAIYYNNKINGNVLENTTQGIFGKYTKDISNKKEYMVANPKNIKLGKAYIHTVLENNTVEKFEIEIIKITQNEEKNKNFIFKITDKKLLDKTKGIVQGMSGSPITQGEYIIGAVTHVVVNDVTKGYGIFITNMLEESEN